MLFAKNHSHTTLIVTKIRTFAAVKIHIAHYQRSTRFDRARENVNIVRCASLWATFKNVSSNHSVCFRDRYKGLFRRATSNANHDGKHISFRLHTTEIPCIHINAPKKTSSLRWWSEHADTSSPI